MMILYLCSDIHIRTHFLIDGIRQPVKDLPLPLGYGILLKWIPFYKCLVSYVLLYHVQNSLICMLFSVRIFSLTDSFSSCTTDVLVYHAIQVCSVFFTRPTFLRHQFFFYYLSLVFMFLLHLKKQVIVVVSLYC